MKTEIVSKDGRVFLIYKGEEYGSYPSGLISVEPRAGKNMVVRLGVSMLFPDSMENTLIDGEQLDPENFEELAAGIDGGGNSYELPGYVLGGLDGNLLTTEISSSAFKLNYNAIDTTGTTSLESSTELPPATTSKPGIMSATDKEQIDRLSFIERYVTCSPYGAPIGSVTQDATTVKFVNRYMDTTTGVATDYDVTLPGATTQEAGIMSASDKTKLDNLTPDSWSFDEAYTGATFVDGKKIYVRTVSYGTLPNAAFNPVAHGIENIDMIVNISGMANDGVSSINIPNVSVTPANAISCYADATNINITTGINRTSFTITYIKLFYTCTDR
ncbi:MAG: hypothetical protein LBU37_10300 [Tannerellaceae bacterium]|jgi:hypothetical protein|nr:hypothetical protein [Tannerellaceae bacterium]